MIGYQTMLGVSAYVGVSLDCCDHIVVTVGVGGGIVNYMSLIM